MAIMCCLAAGAIGISYKCDRCILHTCQWKSWCITRKFCDARYIAVTCDGSCNTYLPKIMDRLNYRRVLLAGVILSIVTTALMGISSSLWMFYLLGILRGIGICCRSGRTAIVDTLFLRTGKLLYCICKDRFSDKCRKFFFDTDRISLWLYRYIPVYTCHCDGISHHWSLPACDHHEKSKKWIQQIIEMKRHGRLWIFHVSFVSYSEILLNLNISSSFLQYFSAAFSAFFSRSLKQTSSCSGVRSFPVTSLYPCLYSSWYPSI